MATTEELEALDREWARLSGWAIHEEIYEGADGLPDYMDWWVSPTDQDSLLEHPPFFSSDPAACFGPDGPWEWLVENASPDVSTITSTEFHCHSYDKDQLPIASSDGATIFEAITRCAIEARKELDGRDG